MKTIETNLSLLFQESQIHDYYWENGYVIISKALKESLIDDFIKQYNLIKNDKDFVFYSQSTHRAMKPVLSESGYITESMENATMLGFYPEFSGAMKNCLFNYNVSKVLSLINGSDNHVMWQNMFFDRSVGTIEHQDHWYLDTVPNGNLVGVWYALENIHVDSGPFFIVPGSHKNDVIENTDAQTHEEFRKKSLEMFKANDYEFSRCLLNKGDILFWHPNTVHGAYSPSGHEHSRKSFTAHYYPIGMKTTLGDRTPPVCETENPHIYRFNQGSDIEYNKQLRKLFDSYKGEAPVVCDMRRDSY